MATQLDIATRCWLAELRDAGEMLRLGFACPEFHQLTISNDCGDDRLCLFGPQRGAGANCERVCCSQHLQSYTCIHYALLSRLLDPTCTAVA
jgi:hypothetical protein